MEITPRDKDFFEYGSASAFLFNRIGEARSYARRVYGKSYCELTPKERADCWKHSEIKFFIKLVRERRAACMMWHIKDKNCGNCKHVNIPEWENPCRKCTHCGNLEGIDNWEPIGREND